MKQMKRLFALVLCLMLLVSNLPTQAFAAASKTNLTCTLSAEEVNVGDTFTVKIGNNAMSVSSTFFGVSFDKALLKVTKISNPTLQSGTEYNEDLEMDLPVTIPATAKSTVDEANSTGNVGVAFMQTEEKEYDKKTTIVTITFEAIAAGEAVFTVYEDSDGTDGYYSDAALTKTLTIKGSEPEPPAHTCTPAKVDGQVATCTEAGYKDYYICIGCGNFYEDADGKSEISNLMDWQRVGAGVIPPKGHDYSGAPKMDTNGKDGTHSFKCVNGCNEYGTTEPHAWDDGVIESGQMKYTCTEGCGATYTEDVACCDISNPHSITLPYSEELTDEEDHYYTWTAEKADNIIVASTTGSDVMVYVNEEQFSSSTSAAEDHKITVPVVAGDEVIFNAYGLRENWTWSWSASFCAHENTKLVSNGDGTHNVVCANEDCGETVEAKVDCSGGTATCEAKAKCGQCGAEYGELADHQYGDLIEATDAVHTKEELKAGVAAHYQCAVCKKLFTADNQTETTLEALTGETPEHSFTNKPSKQLYAAASCDYPAYYFVQCDNCDAMTAYKTVQVGGPLGHAYPETPSSYTVNADGTHTAHYVCGNLAYHIKSDAPVPHTYDETTHQCVCGKLEEFAVTLDGKTDYVEYGESYKPTAPKTTKEGYTFVGYSDSEGGEVITEKQSMPSTNVYVFTVTKDVTLYPIYQANQIGIYWTAKDVKVDEYNTWNASSTVDYGTSLEAAEATIQKPERTGYTFTGWQYFVDDAEHAPYEGTTVPNFPLIAEAQWEINTYTLTVSTALSGSITIENVPYGASLLEILENDKRFPEIGKVTRVEDEKFNGEYVTRRYVYYAGGKDVEINKDSTMPASDMTVYEAYVENGWKSFDDGTGYKSNNTLLKEGWHYIEEDFDDVPGGAWYYFDEDWYRAEGLTRVLYPTEAINGVTYGPNDEDIAYAASKGETFIDATEGWFLFDEDGKFQSTTTGMGTYNGATRWIENGHIAWHPGVVKTDGDYYYFTGDVENGGNILATQAQGAAENESGRYDIYVARANHSSLDREFTIGGIYTFYSYGTLATLTGMCHYGQFDASANDYTKIRLYGVEGADENRLMVGLGLTKWYSNYIYVRSNGECIKSQEYWVPANNLGIPEGMYQFDKYGYMIIPEANPVKDGIVEENGGLYYYEDGKLAYNKGLIKLEDGSVIYVRSNGQLATGEYYVTNVDNYTGTDVKSGDKVTFGADGKMVAAKNGIVDGYYYENGKLAYNAGVVEIEEGKYIYVRSNGQVVMDTSYWITNVGDSGVVAKKYTFDANGIMQNPEFTKDQVTGIQGGYYYVDGKIAYGAGLILMDKDTENPYFIYVRSNGQLAIGVYWPTNKNEYADKIAGSLDFGTDGKCYWG